MFMKNVTTCCLDLYLFIDILSVVVIVSHSKPYEYVGFISKTVFACAY